MQLGIHICTHERLISQLHGRQEVGWVGGRDGLSVSPQVLTPLFALVVGCFEKSVYARACVCVCVSVAVFMACQDVEVAVGCRVVCRPALQHHHPV